MDSWLRPHYESGGNDAHLFYAVFGNLPRSLPALSRRRYRSEGLVAGLTLDHQDPDFFRHGPLWESLQQENPRCAAVVSRASGCLALRGQVKDPPLLDYLRDTVGLLTFLLDQGGVALYDPLCLRWWEPSAWKAEIFSPGQPRPNAHVVILSSPEDDADTVWLHTRGLIKFGRPDLSMRQVSPAAVGLYAGLFNRFIEFQALGGQIEEGREVKMAGLPFGLRCYHGGSPDDPDFNNVHVEIR